MIPNYVDTNLCDFTGQILESWGVKSTKYKKPYYSNSALSRQITNDKLEKTSKYCKDGKDDGKISFKEKMKNFGKGIIKPVKTMFSSPKNIALTAASVIGGAALIAATGGAVAPVMVAAGLLGGGIQIGKGIYKQAKATTDEQAANAWQDMGSGTFTVGVSAVGAKSALKTAGVQGAKEMSTFAAIKNCIKSAPKNISKSVSGVSSKLSTAMNSIKGAASNKPAVIPRVEGEIIYPDDITIIPKEGGTIGNSGKKLNIIDVDFQEITSSGSNDTPLAIVQNKPAGALKSSNSTELALIDKNSTALAINQPKSLAVIDSPKSYNNQISIKSEPLALPGPTQKTGILGKVKGLLKLFGIFKKEK